MMAAKAAVDATLNHDLVSLQVTLQDALQSPKVSFATLHDVENNLLVQAGEGFSLNEQRIAASFSAPISYQQSVAGYVTVYLDANKATSTLMLAFYAGVFLLSLIALLSLIEVWPRVFEVKAKSDAEEPDTNTFTDTLADDSDELTPLLKGEEVDNSAKVKNAENARQDVSGFKRPVSAVSGAEDARVEGSGAENFRVDNFRVDNFRVGSDAAISGQKPSNPDSKAAEVNVMANHAIASHPSTQSTLSESKPKCVDLSNTQPSLDQSKAADSKTSQVRIKPRTQTRTKNDIAQKTSASCTLGDQPAKLNMGGMHTETYVIAAAAKVILQIDGFEKLQSTVSAELAAKLQSQWMSKADAARRIYGGQWETAPHHTLPNGALVATFTSADSDADALRTACFFSQVVKNLFCHGKVSVDVRAVIAPQDEFVALTAFPKALFSLCLSDVQHQQLAKRFSLAPIDGKWFSLDHFDPAHEKLLQRQSQQLMAQ